MTGSPLPAMTILRHNWRAGAAIVGSALVVLSGCGGSADSTSSARPAQESKQEHAVPAEHPSAVASHKKSSDDRKASSQPRKSGHRKPHQTEASHRHTAAPAEKTPSKQTSDAVAEVKDLVGGEKGQKERTVKTPKQVHKVLQEVNDQSGDQTSGDQEADHQSSGSGVEESIEKVLP
jgi:hypothetical protein